MKKIILLIGTLSVFMISFQVDADEEKETIIIIHEVETRSLPDGYVAEDVSWLIDKTLDGDVYEQRESLEELRDIIDEQILEEWQP